MADSRISGFYISHLVTLLYQLQLGAVTLYLGRGALARARWLRKTIFPEKRKKSVKQPFSLRKLESPEKHWHAPPLC